MAASCGYHISKVTQKTAHKVKGSEPPVFIRAHIQLAGHYLTNNHTVKLLSGLLSADTLQ